MQGIVWVGAVLLAIWAVLWLGFHFVGGVVHLLLLAGVVLLVWGLIKRGARTVDRHV